MVNLEYDFDEADFRSQTIKIKDLQPIQLPNIDLDDILLNRKNFTKEDGLILF